VAVDIYMVGLITADMAKALDFYRRLGVDIPEGSEGKTHVEVKMGAMTFFLDSRPIRFDPGFPQSLPPREPSAGYPFLLEFYLKERAVVDAKYTELVSLGHRSLRAPYVTSFNMYFAWLNDPDGNAILLSAD